MFIHFAFSSNKDDPDRQVTNLIDFILSEKKLKFSLNPEFIPTINPEYHPHFQGGFKIARVQMRQVRRIKGGVELDVVPQGKKAENLFRYMKENIRIICFIEVSSTELSTTPHSGYYGKLGLVFNTGFLISSGLTQVYYYTEESLPSDELVIAWNLHYAYCSNLSIAEEKKKRDLEIEILANRKPATLFESFSDSGSLALSRDKVEFREAYERYPIGYDFTAEHEWRIKAVDQKEYLPFKEKELETIFVPNKKARARLLSYLHKEWELVPHVYIYPQVTRCPFLGKFRVLYERISRRWT